MKLALLALLLALPPRARAAEDKDTPGEITRRQLSNDFEQAPKARGPRAQESTLTRDGPPSELQDKKAAPPPAVPSSGDSLTPSAAPSSADGEPSSPPSAPRAPAPAAKNDAGPRGSAGSPSSQATPKVSGVMNKVAASLKSLDRQDAGETAGAASGAGGPERAQRGQDAAAQAKAADARLPSLAQDDPRALRKRPDFYRTIPKEDFTRLRAVLSDPRAAKLPEAKDVGVKDRLDVVWTESCDRISGKCNPLARGPDEKGYKKEEDVSPETLSAVLDQIRRELADEPEAAAKAPGIGKTFDLSRILKKIGDAQAQKDDGLAVAAAASGPGARAAAEQSQAQPQAGFKTRALPFAEGAKRRRIAAFELALGALGAGGIGLFFFLRRRDQRPASPS